MVSSSTRCKHATTIFVCPRLIVQPSISSHRTFGTEGVALFWQIPRPGLSGETPLPDEPFTFLWRNKHIFQKSSDFRVQFSAFSGVRVADSLNPRGALGGPPSRPRKVARRPNSDFPISNLMHILERNRTHVSNALTDNSSGIIDPKSSKKQRKGIPRSCAKISDIYREKTL